VIHYIADLDRFFAESWRVLRPGGLVLTVTDSEEDIRGRTMSHYFPETVARELDRYPAIEALRASMRTAGAVGKAIGKG